MKKEKCGAIILAAGKGSRMQSDTPKQFMELNGSPIFLHSVRCFATVVDEIVVVTNESAVTYCRECLKNEHLEVLFHVTEGGKERYLSSIAGLKFAKDWDYVMIHDAARACISKDVILESLQSAREHGSGIAAVPVKDTIKEAEEDGCVCSTLNRSRLYAIQTPQTFRTDWIISAYDEMESQNAYEGITDDAMVLERFGKSKVYLSKGSYENIKITTPEDLPNAENILRRRG